MEQSLEEENEEGGAGGARKSKTPSVLPPIAGRLSISAKHWPLNMVEVCQDLCGLDHSS